MSETMTEAPELSVFPIHGIAPGGGCPGKHPRTKDANCEGAS
jgi:hypothetical protein